MTNDELKALCESNAKSIQALSQEWRSTAELVREGFQELQAGISEDRQAISANRQAIAENRELSRENAVAIAELLTAQAETNRQIQVLIEESRDSRNWLRAAQENIQTLLKEVKDLWSRVNAA